MNNLRQVLLKKNYAMEADVC